LSIRDIRDGKLSGNETTDHKTAGKIFTPARLFSEFVASVTA